MKILSIIKPIFLLVLLVVGVFFISHYAGPATNQLFSLLNLSDSNVKGASTQRAEELTQQFSSDIGKQVDTAKQSVLNVKVADMLHGLSRLEKIPHDASLLKDYIDNQLKKHGHSQKD